MVPDAYPMDDRELDGGEDHRTNRTCGRCGTRFWAGRHEPFIITAWCDNCVREAIETQMRKADAEAR